MQRMDGSERRRRLAVRHRLAPGARARTAVEAARSVVGLHASDPASVYLQAHARMPDLTIASLQETLYDERALVRILGMRRTMFVVPLDTAPVVLASSTRAIAVAERRRLAGFLEGAGITNEPDRWIRDVEARTMAAIQRRGEAVATDLSKDVPELREQILFGEGRTWQGTMGVSTRILFLLSMEARIVRARPRGSWISSQYRWTPTDRWIPGGFPSLDVHAAKRELVRLWLGAFGPGTIQDVRWWTGWTVADVKRALGELGAVEVGLDEGVGYVLPDDLDRTPAVGSWTALLPALDATTMGWTARDWYLAEHRNWIFDRNGNAGPTVWHDGRIVGGWGQRPDATVVYKLLEDVGSEATQAIEREVERLTAFVDGARVTPRFPTPLYRELAA